MSHSNERTKSVDENYKHHFGEFIKLSRSGNRKITYRLNNIRRKSISEDANVTTSFDQVDDVENIGTTKSPVTFDEQPLIKDIRTIRRSSFDRVGDEDNLGTTQSPVIFDEPTKSFTETDVDNLDTTKSRVIFDELSTVTPELLSQSNVFNDFVIENNDYIIDLTTNDITLSEENNYKDNDIVDSTVDKDIIDKDIIDFVEKCIDIDINDDNYDMNRLWKGEDMLNKVKNNQKKICMSVQNYNVANVQKKIITETLFVNDEIMGHIPSISINTNLNDLGNAKDDGYDNNNKKQETSIKHSLPVLPAPKFRRQNISTTSTTEINQIVKKQINLSQNDPREMKVNARIVEILQKDKIINNDTFTSCKNVIEKQRKRKEIEQKNSPLTGRTTKQNEIDSHKVRTNLYEPTTKSDNQKRSHRRRLSISGFDSKLNQVHHSVPPSDDITKSKKNVLTKPGEARDKKLPTQVSESENKEMPTHLPKMAKLDVIEKKASHTESKSNKHDFSKKYIDKHSKKHKNSSRPKTSKNIPNDLVTILTDKCKTEKPVVQLNKHTVENYFKHHRSQENIDYKKRKIEHSDKTADKESSSRKHRVHSHKSSSNHHKSSHSSSKHKSHSNTSSKSNSSINKINNNHDFINGLSETINKNLCELNELKQLSELKNKTIRNDYKIKQSDENHMKIKIRKISEENNNQTREISSTSELIQKPWDASLRSPKFTWINNNSVRHEDIEDRLALLEKGIQTNDNFPTNNTVQRIENDSISSITDIVSTTNGIEPCVEESITSSSEVTTSCVTPPVNNEELPNLSTDYPITPEETYITQNNEAVANEWQVSNCEQTIMPENEQELIQVMGSFANQRTSPVSPGVEIEQLSSANLDENIEQIPVASADIENCHESTANKETEIENRRESTAIKEVETQTVNESSLVIKEETEIPIIDLTLNDFIKKEEPIDSEIIEIEDELPMLRVKASVFLSQEANNIIESIKTSMLFACIAVRTFDKRISKLTNRIDKTREEVLKTEHIELWARRIQNNLATNLHFFNNVNMFKALTQAINDESVDKKFTVEHVEHVFQLLVSMSALLRKEFIGGKDNEAWSQPSSESNHDSAEIPNKQVDKLNVQNQEQYSNSSNIIYNNVPTNSSNNLTIEQSHNNNSMISNHTFNGIVNNHTLEHSNRICNDGNQQHHYLMDSSTASESNGYYNPQSAQIYSNSSISASCQIPTKSPLQHNEVNLTQLNQVATNQIQDNAYTNHHVPNVKYWPQQISQAGRMRNYSDDVFLPLNLSQQQRIQKPLQYQNLQYEQHLQNHRQIYPQQQQIQHSVSKQQLVSQQQQSQHAATQQQLVQQHQSPHFVSTQQQQSSQQQTLHSVSKQPQTQQQQYQQQTLHSVSKQQQYQQQSPQQQAQDSVSKHQQAQQQQRSQQQALHFASKQPQAQQQTLHSVSKQQQYQQQSPQQQTQQQQYQQQAQNSASKQQQAQQQQYLQQLSQQQIQHSVSKQPQAQQQYQQQTLNSISKQQQAQQQQYLQQSPQKQTQHSVSKQPQAQQYQQQSPQQHTLHSVSKQQQAQQQQYLQPQSQHSVPIRTQSGILSKSRIPKQRKNYIIPAPPSLIPVENPIIKEKNSGLKQVLCTDSNKTAINHNNSRLNFTYEDKDLHESNTQTAGNIALQGIPSSAPNTRTSINVVPQRVSPVVPNSRTTKDITLESILSTRPLYNYNYGGQGGSNNNNMRSRGENSYNYQSNVPNQDW